MATYTGRGVELFRLVAMKHALLFEERTKMPINRVMNARGIRKALGLPRVPIAKVLIHVQQLIDEQAARLQPGDVTDVRYTPKKEG